MKKIIYSIVALGLTVFCMETYSDVFLDAETEESYEDIDDDAKTFVESSEDEETISEDIDDDAKTFVEGSEDEDENSLTDRRKQQARLLSVKKSGKNYHELSILQKNGFVVTSKSLEDLENNFNNAVTVVNMFEPINLNAALLEAFSFAMNGKASENNKIEDVEEGNATNFIVGEYNLPDDIKKNPELRKKMQNFMMNLDNNPKDMSENDIQEQTFESLKEIYSLLQKDKNIGETNLFSKFVKGMIDVYKVLIARRIADEIISQDRSAIQGKFATSRSFSSAEVGAVAKNGVTSAGASASYHTDRGTSASSFYSISEGSSGRINVGMGNPLAIGAEVGASVDVTKSAIFYSLEQLLDSGKVNVGVLGGVLTAKNLKATLKSRQKMQAREKKLLSIFGTNVEGYLKMIGKIPVSTYLEWPKLTKSSPASEAVNISKAIDASVTALKKIVGIKVVTNDDVKTWKRPSGYMSLISEDCLPSDGLSAEDIVKFLGKQYDISETFGGKSDVNVLPTILGDIRSYNSALNILSENKSDSKAEQKKHNIEARWLPKNTSRFNFRSEGRLGVLKSMIATISVLRESAVTDREIELFKQLYTEIYHLAQFMEFSKNKLNRSATFMNQATAHNKSIKASVSVALPYFGNAQVSLSHLIARDNPFQEENGDFLNFDALVPLTPIGIVGANAIDASLNAYRQIMEGAHSSFGYGDTFNLVKKGLNLAENLVKVPTSLLKGTTAGIAGRATISTSLVRIDATDLVPGAIRPLPNKKLITKKRSEWVRLYSRALVCLSSDMSASQYQDYAQQGAHYLKSGINVSKYLDTIRVKYSSGVGKNFAELGTDTLRYITSKFNALSLGLQDSKEAMSPWYSLKNAQKQQFIQLFKNIADETSNVIYELQNMYNAIMNNIEEKDIKTSEQCTRLFEDFLYACDDLAAAKNDESVEKAFKEASELIDKIFRMNFEYNFMNDYKKAYQIQK